MARMSNDELLDTISNMSVLELHELSERIKEKFNISLDNLSMGSTSSSDAKETEVEEKTNFSVYLNGVSADKKIAIVKILKEVLEVDLKSAMGIVSEAESSRKLLLESAEKEKVDKLSSLLKEIDADFTVE